MMLIEHSTQASGVRDPPGGPLTPLRWMHAGTASAVSRCLQVLLGWMENDAACARAQQAQQPQVAESRCHPIPRHSKRALRSPENAASFCPQTSLRRTRFTASRLCLIYIIVSRCVCKCPRWGVSGCLRLSRCSDVRAISRRKLERGAGRAARDA